MKQGRGRVPKQYIRESHMSGIILEKATELFSEGHHIDLENFPCAMGTSFCVPECQVTPSYDHPIPRQPHPRALSLSTSAWFCSCH